MPNFIKEGLTFNTIASRLGATKTLILPLTRGWSVRFEATAGDPDEAVWVDFYYNGRIGRDDESTMSLRLNFDNVDEMFEEARESASAKLKADRLLFNGNFGLAVYKTLCKLSEIAHK